jgi:hypothetical protein
MFVAILGRTCAAGKFGSLGVVFVIFRLVLGFSLLGKIGQRDAFRRAGIVFWILRLVFGIKGR